MNKSIRNYRGRSPIPLENDTEGKYVRCVNCGFVYEATRAGHRSRTSYTRPDKVYFSDGGSRQGTAGMDGMNSGIPLVTMLVQRGIVGLKLDAFEDPYKLPEVLTPVHSGGCPLGCLNYRED